MTVYVDDMQLKARVGRLNARWSHLTADTDEELHEFASKIGLKRAWFQESRRDPALNHYDVTESKRQEAIQQGAVPITIWEAGEILRRKIEESQ